MRIVVPIVTVLCSIASPMMLLTLECELALAAGIEHSPNFTVFAVNDKLGKPIAEAAEEWRSELAKDWLGYEPPRWSKPCVVEVSLNPFTLTGITNYTIDSGNIYNFSMSLVGDSLQRVTNALLPHEITHLLFAFHFRELLPRWLDEGAATMAEPEAERERLVAAVRDAYSEQSLYSVRELMNLQRYPIAKSDVLRFYAQSSAIVSYLLSRGSKKMFLEFAKVGMHEGWDYALTKYYNFATVEHLEDEWLKSLANL